MLKALNAVCFGSYRVRAKVARFDRSVEEEGHRVKEGEEEGGVVNNKQAVEGVKMVVVNRSHRAGEGVKGVTVGENRKWNGKGSTKEVTGAGVVTVGDVVVTVRDGKGNDGGGKGVRVDGVNAGKAVRDVGEVEILALEEQKSVSTKMVRMYRSIVNDVRWAQSGVSTNVVNGEVITVVHKRVTDVGFEDIDIIPMGEDKVFLRSRSDKDTLAVLGEAKEFFAHFFTNVVRWDKEVLPFRRGAWLRLYGIPIHVWNENFFKLCVMDYGTYLRTDEMSLERGRFDFARVLISTRSLDTISCVDHLLIDEILVDIKIVEEGGANFGEDACLFEDVDDENSQSDYEEVHRDTEICKNVDTIVDKIVKELEVGELDNGFVLRDDNVVGFIKGDDIPEDLSNVGSQASLDNVGDATLQNSSEPVGTSLEFGDEDKTSSVGEKLQEDGALKLVNQAEEVGDVDGDLGEDITLHSEGKEQASAVSGPPFAGKQMVSGPWSTEWLKDHHGGADIIFSTKRKFIKVGKRKVKNCQEGGEGTKRQKIGGELRHTIHTLKKVARMSSKDRDAVLRTLKKRASKKKQSVSEGGSQYF